MKHTPENIENLKKALSLISGVIDNENAVCTIAGDIPEESNLIGTDDAVLNYIKFILMGTISSTQDDPICDQEPKMINVWINPDVFYSDCTKYGLYELGNSWIVGLLIAKSADKYTEIVEEHKIHINPTIDGQKWFEQ